MGISCMLWPQKRCSILSTTNDNILQGIPFVFVYLDDILVASKNLSEHNSHLRTVFQLLSDNGLVVNRAKCVFGAAELTYLGHLIEKGISPLPSRVGSRFQS